jgi:hypothetical protein
MNDLGLFLDSTAGLALKAALAAAFLDFATGSFAALRDGTFALDALAAFLRKHILGRVAPLATLLVVGYFGGAAGQPFLAAGIVGLTAYAAETAASVIGNLNPPAASAEVTATNPAAVVNPVPDA